VDDAAHTLFECDAWEGRRRICSLTVGYEISLENLIKIMLESEEKWETITKYISEVMKLKEVEERRREREINIHT